jgi:16S rRNA (cytosine1402-N4)-methyltransferase
MAGDHIPVMLPEVIKYLTVKPGGKYIDCTLGGAGYTLEIAKKAGNKGRVLAMDMDETAIKNATKKIVKAGLSNITLVQENFKNIKKVAREYIGDQELFDGIVFDLGLSSFQLKDTGRGFSFQHGGPLDMAFGQQAERSTISIVNNYKIEELAVIFREFGEEKHAYRIAKAIVSFRKQKKIDNAKELADIIKSQYPPRFYYKIHPATKVFQALRIETNQEFENLKIALPDAKDLLRYKGRLVVVSFHSGEDRIVKRFFKGEEDLIPIIKKPLIPGQKEQELNPRSRSAKLRAAIKIKI